MSRLADRFARVARRGPAYGLYVLRGVLLPRLTHRFVAAAALHRRSRRLLLGAACLSVAAAAGLAVRGALGAAVAVALAAAAWLALRRGAEALRRHRLRREYESLLGDRRIETVEAPRLVDLSGGGSDLDPNRDRRNGDVRLGEIDNDGRLRSDAAIGDLPSVDAADFVRRYRYDLSLVARRGRVLVHKDYRGDGAALRREAAALARLAGSGLAPELVGVGPDAAAIDKTWIPGPTLRDLMVDAGARILSRDTETEEALTALPPSERLERVWRRGRRVLAELDASGRHDVPADLLAALERTLTGIHRHAVTGPSLTFGNIVLRQPGGTPVFLDFDKARLHRRSAGAVFDLARDRDRRLFDRIYDAAIETEASVRQALSGPLRTSYAPLDLGRGLVTRGFWSVDSGTGRWEYLNRGALMELLHGRRVLDLGAHNGALSLMMLRDGARSVIAIERDPERVAGARRLHRIIEWRDLRSYDFEIHCDDMRAILDRDWGAFDIVTAFCSLYYLPEVDMRRVLERARQMAPTLVLQAKSDTRPGAADDKARKSSPEFLAALAAETGWTVERIATRPGFTRPLLVAGRMARG